MSADQFRERVRWLTAQARQHGVFEIDWSKTEGGALYGRLFDIGAPQLLDKDGLAPQKLDRICEAVIGTYREETGR